MRGHATNLISVSCWFALTQTRWYCICSCYNGPRAGINWNDGFAVRPHSATWKPVVAGGVCATNHCDHRVITTVRPRLPHVQQCAMPLLCWLCMCYPVLLCLSTYLPSVSLSLSAAAAAAANHVSTHRAAQRSKATWCSIWFERLGIMGRTTAVSI